jgi:cell division protease FtsH
LRFIIKIRVVKTLIMNIISLKPLALHIKRTPTRRVKTRAVTYSDFLTKVDHNQISDVVVFQGSPEIRFMDTEGLVDTARVILNDTFFKELREHAVNIQIASPPVELDVVPYIFGGLFLYFLFRSMPKPPAFPGTKKEFEVVKDVETRFEDVAGIEQELTEVKEIVDFLKDPKRFTDAGATVPKGCLLSGPPGTGKTLMARAIAGEAGVPFIATSASQFIELFVGLGASRIRSLFNVARENAPCIVFIDELDAIAKSRSPSPIGNNNDEREQTLNQLLTELDGFKENNGIILLGATNRPDVIDPAILRPGRFDRKIEVGLPDRNGREKILGVHAKNKALEETINLGDVASSTTGFSGAELQNLMNEAAIYAARDGRTKISKVDIDNSYEKITIGLPKSKVVDDDTKRLVAYHEAGHTVMGLLCGEKIGKVTILPRGGAGGFTQFIPSEETGMVSRTTLEKQVKIALGGRAAEQIVFGKPDVTTGAVGDLQRVTDLVYQMFSTYGFSSVGNIVVDGDSSEYLKSSIDKEVISFVETLYYETISELTKNRARLNSIAESLIILDTLQGDSELFSF